MNVNSIQIYKIKAQPFTGNKEEKIQKENTFPENLFKSKDPFVLSEELLTEYRKIPQEIVDHPSKAKKGTIAPHELINGFTDTFIDPHAVYRGLCTPKLVDGAKIVIQVAMLCEKQDKEIARRLYDSLWCRIPNESYYEDKDPIVKEAKQIKDFAGQKCKGLGFSLYGPKMDRDIINYLMEELSTQKKSCNNTNPIYLKKDIDYTIIDEEE